MSDNDTNGATDPNLEPSANASGPNTRGISKMPLILGLSVAVLFCLVVMLVAIGRAEKQTANNEEGERQELKSSAAGIDDILGYSAEGGITEGVGAGVAAEGSEARVLTPEELLAQANSKSRYPDYSSALPSEGEMFVESDTEKRRREALLTARLAQLERAATAPSKIAFKTSSKAGGDSRTPHVAGAASGSSAEQRIRSARARGDASAVYKERMAQVQAQLGISGVGGGSGGTGSANRGAGSYSEFDSAGGNRWNHSAKMKTPKAFQISAGFVIPATLISGIISELEGQLTAQVSQNVYDTATGNYLLIPQGAKLVGAYSNKVAYGQSRALVAWQRIVFPDGKSLDLGAMAGVDREGYSGFKDRVNNHYFRLFGSAILMSAVIAGVEISQDQAGGSENVKRASDSLSEALGQQLGEATAQIISKNLNIAPTIEIRSGYVFNVAVTKDLVFKKPYKHFDYSTAKRSF